MSICTYRKNQSQALTEEFASSDKYGKVKLGTDHIFWKKGLSWQYVSINEIQRVYRRIAAADTRVGCCSVNFDIQKLVIELKDTTVCELVIGDGMPKEAELLYSSFKQQHPELSFGKY